VYHGVCREEEEEEWCTHIREEGRPLSRVLLLL